MSGVRTLARMTSIRLGMGWSSTKSRTHGSWSPSWNTSVAFVVQLPGFLPPTSVQCALLAAKARSLPSKKSGMTIATSERWVPPPVYGSLVQKTSPGRMSVRANLSRTDCTV